MRIDMTEFLKSLHDTEYARQKKQEWEGREKVCAPLRNATQFKLCVEDWNFVDQVGYPPCDEWCFIITPSQYGCLYTWGVGGYSVEQKTFYVNYGLGGLVTDQEDVIAWKAFASFDDDAFTPPEFLSVINEKTDAAYEV